jgi:hypothetical protein
MNERFQFITPVYLVRSMCMHCSIADTEDVLWTLESLQISVVVWWVALGKCIGLYVVTSAGLVMGDKQRELGRTRFPVDHL